MPSTKKTATPKSSGVHRAATRSGRLAGSESYCPDAGDFIRIDLNPTTGHEQAGRRPALVLSPRKYNERAGLCIACPITGSRKSYPFETPIPAGQALYGVVLADQPRSLSWPERNAELVGRASPDLLEDVREKLAVLVEF